MQLKHMGRNNQKISSQKQPAEASVTRKATFIFVTSEIMLGKMCSWCPKKGCNINSDTPLLAEGWGIGIVAKSDVLTLFIIIEDFYFCFLNVIFGVFLFLGIARAAWGSL